MNKPKESARNTRRIAAEIAERYPDETLPMTTVEDRIVAALADDVNDRRGLKNEWRQIDEDIKLELLETWREIIRQELHDEPTHHHTDNT